MIFFKPLVLFFLLLCCQYAYAQQLFESGIVYGGVTGGGFSTNTGSGTVVSNVAIPPNSTIKKAYLLATRDGVAPDIDVVLNGNIYTFTNASVISNKFISTINTWTWANSTIHAMDITNNIDSSVTVYSLTIPPQFNITINGFYSSFYLFIVYENPALSKLAYNLFINEQDVAITSTYSLVNFSSINNNNSVGLEMWSTFFCDTIQDGSYIDVNSNQLGLLGGAESNTIHSCTGVYSNFAHYNDSLFGLEDDTPDSLMSATDALADIKSYVNNNDTNVNVVFTLQTPGIQGGKLTNPIAALMLSYSTPCDTFSTTATAVQDTICLGDSVQLSATGGSTYSWFGVPIAIGSGLSDTTIANPLASPPQTTTYIVTIKNDSGCVKTEHIKIWVNPLPTPTNIITTNTLCNDSSGNLTVGIINSNTAPYSYTLTNLETSNTITQAQNTFNNLGNATYLLQIIDINGCSVTDTILINDVQVGCDVSDTLELMITIPNVFTPNGDNENDNFVIQIIGAELLESLETKIFNRWGQTVENRKWKVESLETLPLTNNQQQFTIWNGNTTAANEASEGTYFYIISYTTKAGETVTEKGSVTLLR
ncbi:MAG: gliding motility-associated C-terminal domain-containing protein [Vicingaceae bacterium]|nr:gliding motility-associated C-terminal domain-containing protein [Vicingaceae bacterium]